MTTEIDHRHIYGIMLDTETANGLDDPLFYDIGWEVIDSHGRCYSQRSFVNADIFLYEKDLMKSSYYAKKIPTYWKDIKTGKRTLAATYTIKKAMQEDCKKYGCIFICAHNARFDYRSINNTQRWVTKSKYRYFLPYGLEWWDTMKMAQDVMCKMPTYHKFCVENGYVCKNGQIRKTAEILYRFISKNGEFAEEHTGLADVDIERQILAYCVRQHKAMRKKLWDRG